MLMLMHEPRIREANDDGSSNSNSNSKLTPFQIQSITNEYYFFLVSFVRSHALVCASVIY